MGLGGINLYLNKTTDGVNWEPVDSDHEAVVTDGGTSEVGWNFDLMGNIWGVLRNEDGDGSGWGSRIIHADAATPGVWEFTEDQSDPTIYESPRMFRHGNDLFLVARTDPSGKFWNKSPLRFNIFDPLYHLIDLAAYSLRNHGVAIWRMNPETAKLDHVLDLPGCGDTAFPSIIRTGKHTYRIANYSSPLDKCKNWSWIRGQTSSQGTQIYMVDLEFEQTQ